MALQNLGLTTAANEACISLGAGIKNIMPFAHSLNAEAGRKGEIVKVPVYTTEAAEFDETNNNYAQLSNVVGVDVSINKHPVAGFDATDVQLSQTDVNFFADSGRAAGRAISRKMQKDFFGMVAELSGATDLSATVTETKQGFADLYKTAVDNDIEPSNAVLVLAPGSYAKLLGTVGDSAIIGSNALAEGMFRGFVGFDYVIATPYLPEGVKGFIAEKGAMAFGGRGIEVDESAYKQVGTVTDEGTGAPITLLMFTKPETGKSHVTATGLYGCKIVDKKHIVKLV